MTDELDNRERAKGVPPKMVIKNRPIVKMPAPEKAKSSPILLKILVGYGEQCYYDGYIEESNIAQAEQAIQALIDQECTKARQEALQNWRFDIIGIIQGKELLFADDVRKQLADRRNELSNKENK